MMIAWAFAVYLTVLVTSPVEVGHVRAADQEDCELVRHRVEQELAQIAPGFSVDRLCRREERI